MDEVDGHFDDEGHWVTTHETKRHIHINENGVPDKGNPYIIAKMTGTKPKLSGEYRKKSLQESFGKGNTGKAVHSLKSLPEGSTIKMANGTEYTKTGSGFVSSKSKTGGKQTPQALAKILDGHTKAGKNFEVNPSDIGGAVEAGKNTGAPKPGQGAESEAPSASTSESVPETASASSPEIDALNTVIDQWGAGNQVPAVTTLQALTGLEDGTKILVDGFTFEKQSEISALGAGKVTSFKNTDTGEVFSKGTFKAILKSYAEEGQHDIEVQAPGQSTPASAEAAPAPDEVAPVETASTSPEVTKFNDILSGWAGHYSDGTLTEDDIAAANALKDGTIISVNGKDTYKKVTEHSMYGDYPWFENLETGKWSNVPALKKIVGGDDVQAVQVKDPANDTTVSAPASEQEPTPTSSAEPSAEQPSSSSGGKTMKDLTESLKKYPPTMEGANKFWNEVNSTFDNAPDGTEITFPDEDDGKWIKETHGSLTQWVNLASGDTMDNSEMSAAFLDSDFGKDLDNISAGITYKEPTGAGTPGSSSSGSSGLASQDYSGQKEALSDLIKNVPDASIAAYETVLDEFPEGTIIKVGGKTYEKIPSGDWGDPDTGLPLGESWDVGYELKHYNPQHTLDISIPGENTAASSTGNANTPTTSSDPAQYSASLSGVKSAVDKLKQGKFVHPAEFKKACKSMKDGDGIVTNGKTYIKGTDSSGNPVFHPSDSPQHTYSSTGMVDIMAYQIGLQKAGLSNGVSFKSGSDQSSSGSTAGASPSTAAPTATPSVAAKDTQKSIKNAKTKAAVASALDALPVGTKIHMKNQGETVFTKTEHGFSKESKFWGGTIHTLTDDVVKYVHGKNKYAAPFAIEDTSGGTTDFSDGSSYKAPAHSSTASLQSQSSSSASSASSSASSPKPSAWNGLKAKVQHAAEAFTQARKNAAHWDKGGGMATDKLLRPVTGAVWKKLTEGQKKSLVAYTGSAYASINDALRNGTGKRAADINNMTTAIDQCEAPTDIWLQRGCSTYALSKLFNTDTMTLEKARSKGSQAILDLLSTSANYGQDKGFMSCGSSKGKGFSSNDVILNVYCPKGTKMMYAEPFSHYGATSAGATWNGSSGTTHVSGEHETILQRGTMLRPTKVTVSNGKIYVDVDVIGQNY
jgi:hypothetical protein